MSGGRRPSHGREAFVRGAASAVLFRGLLHHHHSGHGSHGSHGAQGGHGGGGGGGGGHGGRAGAPIGFGCALVVAALGVPLLALGQVPVSAWLVGAVAVAALAWGERALRRVADRAAARVLPPGLGEAGTVPFRRRDRGR